MALTFDPTTLRAARTLANLTQEELAKKMRVSVPIVRRIETNPDRVTIELLERAKAILEKEGVAFVAETLTEGPGIRRSKST